MAQYVYLGKGLSAVSCKEAAAVPDPECTAVNVDVPQPRVVGVARHGCDAQNVKDGRVTEIVSVLSSKTFSTNSNVKAV